MPNTRARVVPKPLEPRLGGVSTAWPCRHGFAGRGASGRPGCSRMLSSRHASAAHGQLELKEHRSRQCCLGLTSGFRVEKSSGHERLLHGRSERAARTGYMIYMYPLATLLFTPFEHSLLTASPEHSRVTVNASGYPQWTYGGNQRHLGIHI